MSHNPQSGADRQSVGRQVMSEVLGAPYCERRDASTNSFNEPIRRLSEEFLPAQRAGGQDDDGLGGHDDRVTVELHRATAVCGLREAVGVKVGAGCCDACLVELGVLQESGDVELSARWQHCVRDRRCGRQDGGGDVIQQHWKPAHQSQGRNDPDLPRRSMSWSSKRTPLKGGAPN